MKMRSLCHEPPHPAGTGGRVGWMRGPGACPSSPFDSSGFRDANGSHPHEDRHQATASTPLRPLSLQNLTDQEWQALPDSFVKNHRYPNPLLYDKNCITPEPLLT